MTCEVCESVAKSVIRRTDEFHGFIKLQKRSVFVKGVPFVNRRYTKVVPFLCKNGTCKGLEVRAESPCMKTCCVNPPPRR